MTQPIAAAAFLLCVCSALGQTIAPSPPRRLALIVANSQYRFLPAHPSAKGEGARMQQSLQSLGFQVVMAQDLSRDTFASVESDFVSKLLPGDLCWVYYAGYTLQADGINYLVTTDFDPTGSGAASSTPGHALARLQQRIDQSGAVVKVFAIENARETPKLLPVSSARRLAVPDLQDSTQSLVAYATQPNQGDSVEEPDLGLFTKSLAATMGEQGIPLFEIFQRVQANVQMESKGRQMPYFVQNITRSWFLREPVKEDVVRTGVSFPHPRDRQEYVWIPAGTFLMGCVPSELEGAKCRSEESPRHSVTITKSFWIGRNEVETFAYKRFIETNKGKRMPKTAPFWNKKWSEDKDSLPVAFVSWEDSRDYCNWVGGRLPTEAEWEYVARGGSKNQVFPHDGSDSRDKANFMGKKANDRFEDPAPVRKFDPNAFGVYDMAGNVWEWTQDRYSPTAYSASPATDPQGPDAGEGYAIRGGSFASDPNEHLRISYRKGFSRGTEMIGFRCILPDSPDVRKALAVR